MPTKNRKKRNRKTGRRRGVTSANHIPQFQANVRFKHRFRFMSTSNQGSLSITRAMLLNLYLSTGAGPAVYRVFHGVKLNKIEMWSPEGGASSSGAPQQMGIEWLSNLGPTSEVSDTGNMFNWAHVVTSPPRNSLAGFWSMSGQSESEILFNLQVPLSAVIDIWVEIILNDGNSAVVLTGFTNSPTSGVNYFSYLDGPGSTSYLSPVSVSALF